MGAQLDHFYVYGDVYAALSTCEELEMLLNRLHRQQLLTNQDWTRGLQNASEISRSLEAALQG
jgi:hypothetical protein